MNWCHFINFWGQVLNWCQLIKFWGLVLNWCQLINIWGHVLLIILEVDCGLCPLLMFSCFSAAAAAGVVPLNCTSPDNNRPFQALFPLSDFILNPCPQFIKTKTRKRHSKRRCPKLKTYNRQTYQMVEKET